MNAKDQYGNLSPYAIYQLTAHARLASRCIAVALQDLNGLNQEDAASARRWFQNNDESAASFTVCCAGISNVQRYLAHMSPEGPTALVIGTMALNSREAQELESLKEGLRELAALNDVSPLASRGRLEAAEQLETAIYEQCDMVRAFGHVHGERELNSEQTQAFRIEALDAGPSAGM